MIKKFRIFVLMALLAIVTVSYSSQSQDRVNAVSTTDIQYPINFTWSRNRPGNQDRPFVFNMIITEDSLRFFFNDIYYINYYAPMRDADRRKIADALSDIDIGEYHYAESPSDSCSVVYGGEIPPDSIAKRLVGAALSLSPFLPEVYFQNQNRDGWSIAPKLNPIYSCVDSMIWKKLTIIEWPWSRAIDEIYSDGRGYFFNERIPPHLSYRDNFKQKEVKLTSSEIDSISGLLYRCNPRGFLEYRVKGVEDGNFYSLVLDGRVFFRSYPAYIDIPEPYRALYDLDRKYLSE